MEDYIFDARFNSSDKELMRAHFKKLERFIQDKIREAVTIEEEPHWVPYTIGFIVGTIATLVCL